MLKRVETDETFALSVLDTTFKKDARRQLNKEGVIVTVLEYLQNEPLSAAESNSGPEALSNEFIDRFERYAEDASTDDLRERWGRVLAGEIRKPGTFNRKVLRAVDELDSKTAMLFESLAHASETTCIFKILINELSYQNKMNLFSSGITLDSSDKHIQYFGSFVWQGQALWSLVIDDLLIAIPKNINIDYSNSRIILLHSDMPALSCYHLSEIGTAIRSILMVKSSTVASRIAEKLEEVVPKNDLLFSQKDIISLNYKKISSIN